MTAVYFLVVITAIGLVFAFGPRPRLNPTAGGTLVPLEDEDEIAAQPGHDIYTTLDVHLQDVAESRMAMLWLLNLSDGEHSLLDIAERAQIPFRSISETAEILRSSSLLVDADAIPGKQARPGPSPR